MKKDIADLWVKALRSGKYAQGKHSLNSGSSAFGNSRAFCCLGVLCELAIEAGVPVNKVNAPTWADQVYYDGNSKYLPPSVMEWADIKTNSGQLYGTHIPSLADLNDKGSSFEFLADKIETYWEGM